MQITKPLLITFLCLTALLSGCKSRPELAQVSSDAPTYPINTPEAAQELRAKYGK